MLSDPPPVRAGSVSDGPGHAVIYASGSDTRDALAAGAQLFHLTLILNGLVILALGFLASRWQRLALPTSSPLYRVRRLPRHYSRGDHPLVLFAILAGAFLLHAPPGVGDGPYPLRLTVAGLSVAALWAYYRFARRVVSWPEPLLGLVVFAMAVQPVTRSPHALGELGLLVWTLLGSSLFVRNLRRPRISHWIVYAVVMALALFTHGAAAVVLVSHGVIAIALLIHKALKGDRLAVIDTAPLGSLVLCGLLTMQLYALILPQVIASWAGVHGAAGVLPWTTALSRLMGESLASPFRVAAMMGTAGLAIIGLWSLARMNRLIPPLFLLPCVSGLAAWSLFPRHVSPRVLIVGLPLAALGMVHGAMVLGRAAERGCRRPHFR